MTYQYEMSESFKRRFLALESFMNRLERMLTAGGMTTGLKTRALKHVLKYVTSTEIKANFVSSTELHAELVKARVTDAKRAANPTAAATEDTLQLLRKTRRAAANLRTKTK